MTKFKITSIRLPETLICRLKIFAALTDRTMGDFIRLAVTEKIEQLKAQGVKPDEKNTNE
jgi:predicted DNA-binding protein